MAFHLICTQCDCEPEPLDWRCQDCGGLLDFNSLPIFQSEQIHHAEYTVWRYRDVLEVSSNVSLGEGMTPLAKFEYDGMTLYAKLDYLNPTGSYKDRGVAVMMNHIASYGVDAVVEDSSGNAGASVSAYSGAMGIDAQIYVPLAAAPAKKDLIRTFGGTLVEIDGSHAERMQACMDAAETTTYASHAWSPYFVLGQMTVAWEIWEQLGQEAPDIVICPIGHGGYFLGYARGFQVLLEAGLIKRIPQLVAVQSSGCDPIVQAWEIDAETPPHIEPSYSVADGILVNNPVRGREVLAAIRSSDGFACRVDNQAIEVAQQNLHRRGFLAELTSSVTLAALPQVIERFGYDKRILLGLTGNALKMIPNHNNL